MARHKSQQTPCLMEPVKQSMWTLYLSTMFLGPTAGVEQMKVTAQVRHLITSGASQYTREWTKLECPLSGSKCSPNIKHTNNLKGLQTRYQLGEILTCKACFRFPLTSKRKRDVHTGSEQQLVADSYRKSIVTGVLKKKIEISSEKHFPSGVSPPAQW